MPRPARHAATASPAGPAPTTTTSRRSTERVYGADLQLRGRPPEEGAEREQLVGQLRPERRLDRPRGREPRAQLQLRAAAGRDRPDRRDPAVRDEERSAKARLDRRREDAELERTQP